MEPLTVSEKLPRSPVPLPRLTVRVTQEDIDDSIRRSSTHCMTAEAIKRDYPHMRNVAVDVGQIRLSDPNTGCRYMYVTPTRVAETIWKYDHGEEIKPFRLGLRVGGVVRMHSKRKAVSSERVTSALDLASTEGDAVAAQHFGVAEPTIRSWRRRRDQRLQRAAVHKQLGSTVTLVDNPAAPVSDGNTPVRAGGELPRPSGLGRQRRYGRHELKP